MVKIASTRRSWTIAQILRVSRPSLGRRKICWLKGGAMSRARYSYSYKYTFRIMCRQISLGGGRYRSLERGLGCAGRTSPLLYLCGGRCRAGRCHWGERTGISTRTCFRPVGGQADADRAAVAAAVSQGEGKLECSIDGSYCTLVSKADQVDDFIGRFPSVVAFTMAMGDV